jgi:hypothetical protein
MDAEHLSFLSDPLRESVATVVPKVYMGADLAVPLLRVNDWLLRINDVDLINKDKKQAIKALLNGEGAINMVVRRRKSLGGKVVTPLHINLTGQKGSKPAGVADDLSGGEGLHVFSGACHFQE